MRAIFLTKSESFEMNFIDNIKNWPFLQEPLYRWAIFFIAMCLIAGVWRCVLSYMD